MVNRFRKGRFNYRSNQNYFDVGLNGTPYVSDLLTNRVPWDGGTIDLFNKFNNGTSILVLDYSPAVLTFTAGVTVYNHSPSAGDVTFTVESVYDDPPTLDRHYKTQTINIPSSSERAFEISGTIMAEDTDNVSSFRCRVFSSYITESYLQLTDGGWSGWWT